LTPSETMLRRVENVVIRPDGLNAMYYHASPQLPDDFK
jgi:hypothetical protein